MERMARAIFEIDGEYYVLQEDYDELEEENKTLKDNVEFLHSCLDDRDKSIAIMQEENKNLKKELEKAHTAYRAVRKVNRAITNEYV